MARRGGVPMQRPAAPTQTHGQPPPSTIAAQILNNAANANAQIQKETFGQLVQQYLDDIDPDPNEPDSQLTNIISLFVEAGLEVVLQDNPFSPDQQIATAVQAIHAIILTIQRRPHLLLNAKDHDDDATPRPPLFVWLLPKLLGLMGQSALQPVQEALQEFLSTCISVFSRTTTSWRHAISITRIYIACIDGILAVLDDDEGASWLPQRSVTVTLPPSSSISDFWPGSEHFVALPQGCQRTITSRPQAFLIGFYILRVIADHVLQATKQAISPPVSSNHQSWVVESCATLWQHFRVWSAHIEASRIHDEIEAAFLHVLRMIPLPNVTSRATSSGGPSSKAISTLSTSLSDLIQSCSTSLMSSSNQLDLATLLTRLRASLGVSQYEDDVTALRHRDPCKLVDDSLTPIIFSICRNTAVFNALERDLQLALCLWTSPGEWPVEVNDMRNALCSPTTTSFSNEQLQLESASFINTFKALNVAGRERPSKRQKVLLNGDNNNIQAAFRTLAMKLNGSTPEAPLFELSSLPTTIVDTYMAQQDDSCELLTAFSKIACAGSRCLMSGYDNATDIQGLTCRICDGNQKVRRNEDTYWDHGQGLVDSENVMTALIAITSAEEFRDTKEPRILMAVAIKRFYNHISRSDSLNLADSALGQWLMGCMSRSLRELRAAAAQALIAFLRDDISITVRGKNRMMVLQFFKALSERNVAAEHETLIMAYGQAACVCGEDEMPIILLQLVEYLGNPNALICSMAFNELAALAAAYNMDVSTLLRPFSKSIGFSVIKDHRTKPQKVQQLADLTGQSVVGFLLSIHTEILPLLVLTKRVDILDRIAEARGKGTTVEAVLTQPRRNLPRVVALLLSQPVTDAEQNAWETLMAVAPRFKESYNDLADLVSLDLPHTAGEILKLAAEEPGSNKAQYHRGVFTLAQLDDMRENQRRSSSKKKPLKPFFEKHILGIMTLFSEVLDAPHANYPLLERKRCVGAIGELIQLAKQYISYALPQVRASLQSAMADPHLCDQTFLVWSSLLAVLEEEDLDVVIDQTFALVAQNWACFSDETHLFISHTLDDLIKKHDALLRERIEYLPSLSSIPMLSKFEGEISRLKAKVDRIGFFKTFSLRCNDENAVVVRQAVRELHPFLEENQKLLHETAVSQNPFPALSALTRSLLDASVRFSENHTDISISCARCLGLIGGLDPYKVETVREKKHMLALSNFDRADEVISFTTFFLEHVLVKVFHSTTNAKSQGFLAYVMQELLKHCGFTAQSIQRPRASQSNPTIAQRWDEIPEEVRSTLRPFLESKYTIQLNNRFAYKAPIYPIFSSRTSHSAWLRTFVYDLLQNGKGHNPQMMFPVLARIIKDQDLSIPAFVLPYAALNVIVTGEEQQMMSIGQELLIVLETELQADDHTDAARIKHCSENVFQTLDYLALWLQEKRKAVSDARVMAGKTGRGISEADELENIQRISCVERILQLIPAEVISKRAVECGSYARALYHWEQYYRQEQLKAETSGGLFAKDDLLQHLQFIYAQIDEPDSIEGISAHLQVLNPEQQIMEHRKSGRWTAAQSWYELSLTEKPNDVDTQINLLTCLKESGQYDAILNYVNGFHASDSFSPSTLRFAAEAAWSTGKWDVLQRMLTAPSESNSVFSDFDVGVGRALLALRRQQTDEFKLIIENLREAVARGLSPSSTASLHASHENLVKLHALYEIEAISGIVAGSTRNRETILENLDRRLDILGAYTSDKQYLLGIRRAAMQLSSIEFTKLDIASAWLTSARLARKADFTSTAHNSVMHAAQLGDDASKIEYSKLMWKQGHHRKAIQNLQGAIASNSFQSREMVPVEISVTTTTTEAGQATNKVQCHAQLLLAKWLDRAGQTKVHSLKDIYASAVMLYPRWDKGHYYLGRFYNKVLDFEKQMPHGKQSKSYLAGETHKLVIDNYIRSVVYGTKYYYQTIPKVLTLWLDMGMEVFNSQPRAARDKEYHDHKVNFLELIHRHIKRYTSDRMPAFSWYTAFPQIITRISHPHKGVWEILQLIILKVASQYPQQALWSLLAVTRATQDDRRTRGMVVVQKLKGETSKRKNSTMDLKTLIIHGQRLTDALLAACDAPVEQRVSHVSLSRDLGFNHKLAPCLLVVPIEATMIASLPTGNDSKALRNHNPFPQDAVTISAFMDDVLVLSSLQRPRKVDVRGSDGRSYGLLCKPKDDLRKDQRLMEFNAMINRALQQDIESSKRRLYIKTYGVTPLNEECGTIEWVEGLKPMRDIIIRLYRQKAVPIDYGELRMLLTEACSDPSKVGIFTHKILSRFQPVLHEWFVETFPEPEAWFAARLRYTRSCAVMSIVGYVLGLGDRHGENVLLEEGNGGTFHVDFNCLFDKGLTFEKPELVPFRLTHNMVDAMGPQGVEGPFRTAAELTYSQLRTHEDTLITILETFVHDPTADFLGAKRKRKIPGVPDTPQEVLESVRAKVAGLLRDETVPLSVEGYVDALIASARDPRNLAAMYIGWCAFF